MLRPREEATPARKVADALAHGELAIDDLTARRLGAFVGKTSSVLYRLYGSLDLFLHAVAQEGFRALARHLGAASAAAGGDMRDVAAAFVAFGLDRPALYHLMFEHRYDWEALRRSQVLRPSLPGLELWNQLVAGLAAAGSEAPTGDARLLYAGLHGLVSLAGAGRANVGDLATSDRDVALASARDLVDRLCPEACHRL